MLLLTETQNGDHFLILKRLLLGSGLRILFRPIHNLSAAIVSEIVSGVTVTDPMKQSYF